jgi:membrane protease YdiL (CAAX protease family)
VNPPPADPPSWKVLLALLSLSLSLLLWLEGLAGSLERPSVETALDLRQLELSALVEDHLPPHLRPLLVGDAPRQALADALEESLGKAGIPAPAQQRLELSLLRRGSTDRSEALAADQSLRQLIPSVEPARRPLLEALVAGRRVPAPERTALLRPWQPSPLLEQLSCEQLGGGSGAETCPADRDPARRVLQLLAVNVLPLLLLLTGLGLLIRMLRRLLAHRQAPFAPLVGPPLTPIDATLLIAGGFVLVGELVVPGLLEPPLTALVQSRNFSPPLAEGIRVLVLYLGLMAAPLLLLVLLLPGRLASRPAGGWLQWHWRPLATATVPALALLLMLLPPVALSGWLVGQIWGDPGGSNPLLELVLTSGDPWALACFALTAMVLAPLFEETLFRGILLPVLGQRLGGTAAVGISAAVFALAHLSLGELMPLFVLGIGLGLLRWHSGRLASSVIAHALWNGLTFANLLLLADGAGGV